MSSELIKHITDASFEADVLQSTEPVLVGRAALAEHADGASPPAQTSLLDDDQAALPLEPDAEPEAEPLSSNDAPA